ncbi:MAG: 2-dehydropantoate 2-reductase [Parasporobacterium sp.]|nr:2-dehydropantoate 2-reductase [Parasporobacterium sp.]
MIRQVAVIGAGAVGSFFLEGLNKAGCQVFAVASGERKERLERNGIVVNGRAVCPVVKTPEESKGADLIIVCVKYNALPEVLDLLELAADEHTILLCPMNGVDTEEIIAGRMGKQRILHSMMIIAAERDGNEIIYNEGAVPCVHYGQAEGFGSSRDLEALTELFERTGLTCKYQEEIITSIWNKFALNISTNIAQAIVNCSYGAYKISPYMNALGQKLCDEVLAVADARKIRCTFDNQRALQTIRTSDAARFSTLQDLSAGRHTEVDMFCGTVVKMGRESGVDTPFNEFAWLAIKALEERNDGLIG